MAADLLGRFFGVTFLSPCLIIVFCLSCTLCLVSSSNPVMAPLEINSQKNVHWANASSYIKWGDVPITKSILLSNEKTSDGLGPLFQFSRFFMNTALNNKLPIDLIKKIQSGNVDIMQDAQKLILDHVGFLVAIVIGVAFVLIFPLIGFCFCLCRCCGKCGGKMIQTSKSRSPTRRRVLSFVLFLGVALSATGTAFMFASDSRLTSNIEKVPDTLSKVMRVIANYGNNTFTQVNFVGGETVNFLLDVIKRDLDSLDVLVGKPIREELDQKAHIRNIFTTIKDLANNIQSLESSMNSTMGEIDNVKTLASNLDNKMTTLKQSIDTDYNNCKATATPPICQPTLDLTSLTISFSSNKLPNLTNEINLLSGIDLLGKIKKPETDFEDIPELVQNKSAAKVQGKARDMSRNTCVTKWTDVKKIIDDVQSTIPEYINKTRKFTTDMDNGIVAGQNLAMLTNTGSDMMETVKPINQIRSYAFLGLAGLCLFIVGLLLFGLVLGVCGHDDHVNPVYRGSTSNCGGCLLMGAVYLIFLTGWFLMLLTTVMFIPGAVTEIYGCKTLREIGQGSVDNMLEQVWDHNFGKIMFNNDSYDVKLSKIYNGCENGQGLYKAAYLNYFVNLDSIFNYPQDNGVKKDLTSIKVNLSDVEILTPEIKKQLDDFKSSLQINFNAFKTEISKTNSPTSLTSLANTLSTLSNVPSPHGAKFAQHATDVNLIENNELKQLINSQSTLTKRVDDLEKSSILANNSIYKVMDELTFAQDVINNKGSDIVKNVLIGFADRILKVWGDFVTYIKDLLDNKIAKCRPITDLYNYLLIDMACGVVDSFNAYWFGLGWCLFFLVFNLCIAVKLAKYFRRMNYSDELDGSADLLPSNRKSGRATKNGAVFMQNNKVGQSPRY